MLTTQLAPLKPELTTGGRIAGLLLDTHSDVLSISYHKFLEMEIGHKTLQTWLNLTFALRSAWRILGAMAQIVGAALLGAAGTAFLAPGSPGPVSQTAPSLRGTAPGNPGSAGVAGTAALASLAGARWWEWEAGGASALSA